MTQVNKSDIKLRLMSEKNKTEEDGRKINAIKEKIIDLGGAGERSA